MTDIAIRVDNLSKLYPEPAARACPELLAKVRHLGAVPQRPDTTSTVLCAAPRRGNTRLKILSRITEPTSGRVHSLLAVGDAAFQKKRWLCYNVDVRAWQGVEWMRPPHHLRKQ